MFPNSGQRERRAFEYYFQHTAQHLAGGMKVDFWTSVIPQICRSEPAVWDGMIAISTLFEYPNQSLDFTLLRDPRRASDSLNQIQREALTWYSRSISSVHSQIERGTADPYIILVSCVLFICVETIQGRMEEALQLFKQGVTLIFNLRAQIARGCVSASKTALLERAIIPLFLRLASVSLTISGTEKSEIFAFVGSNLNSEFLSVEDARTSITVLSAEVLVFEREAHEHLRAIGPGSTVNPEMSSKKEMLQHRLAKWHAAYTNFCENNNNNKNSAVIKDYEPLLPIYHAALSIHLASCLNPLESIFDSQTAEFEKIIEQSRISLDTSRRPDGSQPPFSFEAGVGVPLFLTALKCREPRLRRSALQLLREAPQMQGLFKCTPSVLLAEAFMNLEEGYSMAIPRSAQSVSEGLEDNISVNRGAGTLPPVIPEEARIHFYCVFRPSEWRPAGVNEEDIVKFGCSSYQLFLQFSRNHFDVQRQIWVQIFECIPFGGDM